jgi:ribonuclease HI
MQEKTLIIYTDGACSGNPGPGGWGAVMIWGDNIKEIAGFEAHTTNNRMEMRAAIEALKQVKKNVPIEIYCDSQYLLNGITKWFFDWLKKDWKKVKNDDLWKELLALTSKKNIRWHWVRGHNGDKYNEIADSLARTQIEINNGKQLNKYF